MAIATLLTLLPNDQSWAQGELTAPSTGSADPVSGFSQPLSPAIRKALEAKLAQEEKASKIGIEIGNPFPMPVCDGGKCGAINRDGTFAVVPAYNRVDPFFEGRAVVQVRHRYSYLYGYVDDTGRVIWTPQFAIAGQFSRGFAQVDFDGKSGLIDREGQVALWPQFGFVVPFTRDRFWVTEERNIVQGNNGQERFLFDTIRLTINGVSDTDITPKGKWGLVDRAGAWIRRPEFAAIRIFDRGDDASLMWARTDAGWGLIRSDLSWHVEPKFDAVGPLWDGLAIVVLNHRWGFVDATGSIVIEPRFDYLREFSGPYAAARLNGLYGLIDRSGAWVLKPQYDMMSLNGIVSRKSWWTTKQGEKYGLLDDKLREVITPQLDQSAALCTDGRIIGFIDRKWKLFARDGQADDDAAGCDSMISSRRREQGP